MSGVIFDNDLSSDGVQNFEFKNVMQVSVSYLTYSAAVGAETSVFVTALAYDFCVAVELTVEVALLI